MSACSLMLRPCLDNVNRMDGSSILLPHTVGTAQSYMGRAAYQAPAPLKRVTAGGMLFRYVYFPIGPSNSVIKK